MSNSFYTHGAFPSTGSAATSASMRAELDLISAGFDKMPTLSGNANLFVVINSTGTGLTQTATLPSATFTDTLFTIQDDGDNTRKFQFNASTVTPGATRIYSVPDANTTLVGTDTTQTLTNKTLTAPVISSIVNTGSLSLPTSTDTLVGRATTDTLTNKTLTSPVIATIVNTGTLTLPTSTDTLVGRATTDTLTNKTLTSPVIATIVNTGTLTLPTSTDTLVGRATTDTLTNKTLTSPVIATIVNTGTLTLPTSTDTLVGRATTDTLTNKTLTSPVIATIVNTGTLTLPTSTDTLVGRATTDTLTNKTLGAFTISGTVSGGGNQINNVIIGASTPLAGSFTTLSTTGLASLPSTGRSAAAALTVTNPAFLYGVASTYTDTASSGVIAAMAPFYSISGPTLSTSNVTTYTNSATLYIANAPTAGGSATITNPYAVYVAAGAAYFGGAVTFAGSASLAGLTVTSLTNSGLTSGRVPYSTTAGLQTDSANLTFNGTTLTANTIGAFTLSGTVAGGGNQINNVIIGTSTPLAGAFTTLSAATSITNTGLTSGRVVYSTTGGLETDSANLTFDGTNLTLAGGTANGVTYLNGSKVLTSGSAIIFDGTNLAIGQTTATNKLTVVSADSTNAVGSSTASISITNTYTSAYGYSSDLIYRLGGGAGTKLAGISGVYTSGGGELAFYTYNNTTFAEKMRIDSSGNVGVGTTSPAGLAQKTFTTQVTGTSSVAITVGDYSSTSGSTNTMIESLGQRYDGNTSFGGRIGAAHRRSDGTAIASGISLGYYLFGGQWGTDTSYQQAKLLYSASIVGVAESSFTSASTMSTAIVFATGSTGNAWSTANVSYGTERMRITSAGDVGIGVNGPGAKLDVSGVIRSTGTGAILTFSKRSTGTGDAWGMYSQSGEYNIYDYTAGVSRLVIDTSGTVLVGITSATASSLIQLSNDIAGTAGASNKISLYYASAASAFGFGVASGQLTYNSGDGAHVFYNGGNTSPVERMRISSTGAVSIVGTLTTGNPSPAVTVYTSGSGTYTTPTGAKYLVVELVGGGGGGSGSGAFGGPYGGDGTVGGTTTFGTSSGVGGDPGTAAGGGSVSGAGGGYTVGGTSGVGISGGRGWGPTLLTSTEMNGCAGGSTPFGCAGGLGSSTTANTFTGTVNTGGGGIGGFAGTNQYIGTGGGGGGYVKVVYASPSATYSYAVGAGGAGGAKATGCRYGETGSAGLIIVTAYYD